jgi:hypothetical protein
MNGVFPVVDRGLPPILSDPQLPEAEMRFDFQV